MAEAGYVTTYQPVALGGVTELLVHGVGGESPAHTLDEPHPVQVAGDTTAGFYRGPDVAGRHREAYSWGGLTSGKASRALWILLLPFALANLAGWMHRRAPGSPESRLFRGLIRLFGLSLTVLAVLFACSIALDLVAYQCAGVEVCRAAQRSSQPWWSPGRWVLLLGAGWLDGNLFRQLVAAAVPPVAAVGLLGYLARATRTRHERTKPVSVDAAERSGKDPFAMDMEDARGAGLEDEGFWFGEPLARALGRAHLAAGLAAVAWAVAAATRQLGASGWEVGTGRVLAWLVLALTVLAMCVPNPFRIPVGTRELRWDLRYLPALGAAALVLAAYGAWRRPAAGVTYPASVRPDTLPGLGGVARLVYWAHLALIVLLAVYSLFIAGRAALRRRRGADGEAHVAGEGTLRGGSLAAAVLASVTATSALAGLSMRVADMLGWAAATGAPVPGGAVVIRYPRVYDLFAVGFAGGLLLVATVLLVAWLRTGKGMGEEQIKDEYLDEYQHDPPDADLTGSASWSPKEIKAKLRAAEARAAGAEPRAAGAANAPTGAKTRRAGTELEQLRKRWVKGIRRKRRLAQLVTRLDAVLVAVVLYTILLALAALAAERLGRPLSVPDQAWWGRLAAGCSWLVAFIPAAGVGVIVSGYRDHGRRRQLAVLWDVCMFWPRAFHPLAPPSYGERAVPDLQRRILRLVKDRGGRPGRVLLMAHSQGTVLAVAALLQLVADDEQRRRVGLVTYGAPLTRLYRRAFPAYVGGGQFTELQRSLAEGLPAGDAARWWNFSRRTDLIGGEVFTDADQSGAEGGDRVLRDPSTSRYVPEEPMPPLLGHSGYMKDPEMRDTVDALARRLLDETGGHPVPPPPPPPTPGPPPRAGEPAPAQGGPR